MLKSYAIMVEKGVLESVFLTREIPAYFSSSRTTHYTDVVKERRKLYLHSDHSLSLSSKVKIKKIKDNK